MAEPRTCAFDKTRICNEQCAAYEQESEITVSVLERSFDNGPYEWVSKGRRVGTYCRRMGRPVDKFSHQDKIKLIKGGAN